MAEHIKKTCHSKKCSYCNKSRKAMSFKDLADWVDVVYRQYFAPGEMVPSWPFESEKPTWQQDGQPPNEIIAEILEVGQEVATDVANYLYDYEKFDVIKDGAVSFFDPNSCYELAAIFDEHSLIWNSFCFHVKHESRYFCEEAAKILKELFFNVAKYDFYGETAPIRKIGGISSPVTIFRARRANTLKERSDICKAPEKEMGPPPREIVKAGRLNPVGIPVFYGAFDTKTCISEIRLAVGEKAVTCGFEITKPLVVLDLTAFENLYSVLSMFDPAYASKASHLLFLRRFQDEVSKAYITEEEDLEYIPTQALVEFLMNFHDPKIDAVIYSSPQTNKIGKNIAILSHAIAIESSDVQINADINRSVSEYYYDDSVHISFPLAGNSIMVEDSHEFSVHSVGYGSHSEPTLRCKKDSLELHTAKAVDYSLDSLEINVSYDDGTDALF